MTVVLVRHAASVPPTPDGPSERDRPLSPLGLEQARALVGRLAAYHPQRILSSPYRRAVQTVQPTADMLRMTIEQHDALREWSSGLGATEGWRAHYRYCWEHPEWSLDGGETHAALQERAAAAVERAAAEEGVTLLASHGTWISRALLALGAPVDADFWLGMPMPAAYEVHLGPGGPRLSGPGL